ncbi:response regulator transcription factor [Cupriavidus numazuensis]|uniref:Transcriptional regulatory protein RcsB n=1 Tax=Cupriavidus numazuensis TaxID=221992 RepID=A0ABM8TUC2_9BURK|nr:response regulator transcription factor [Cupriavidus numazuensis]CAG2160160.1 Transcriptional regulatory protein RcsB [Cupriavidus numazuensis]
MIRVLVADDHPIVLSGIRQELSRQAGMEMVGMARNSTELIRLLDATACDVVVTDYSMPGGEHGDGIAMLEMLRRRYPNTRIVVFTMLENALSIRNIRSAGVPVVLSKTDPLHHLAPAIRAAFSDLSYVPPSLREMAEMGEMPDTSVTGEGGPESKLSQRELEVLRQCAAGISLIEIARQANRSRKTISVQKNMAMKKLGLSTGYELYQYAIAHGLLPGRQ